jgi:hypothetical protein
MIFENHTHQTTKLEISKAFLSNLNITSQEITF